MLKRSLVLIALLSALSPQRASAQLLSWGAYASPPWTSAKADDAVEKQVQAGKSARIIVRYRPEYRSQVVTYVRYYADKLHAEVRGMNVVALQASPGLIKYIAGQYAVLNISLDSGVRVGPDRGVLAENPYYLSPEYDGQKLRETLGLLPQDTGRGVGVAIVDSGIAPTADLAGRISAFYDFTQTGAAVAAAPSDGYGHGTHVAGLVAGSGAASNGKYVGTATAARLIGLKVLDATGAGFTSDVIAAIDFATANKTALGIDVINMSLGHPIFEPATTDPMVQAVERAVRAGIVVVVSAGNIGMNAETGEVGFAGVTSPGNAPSALTIGAARHKATATRDDDEVATFSSRGPTWYDGRIKPDVIAPGQALIATASAASTLYANSALRADVPGYIRLSGTSMAAAVASGVVATMIDTNRRDEGATSVLKPNAIKAILQYTAIPVATANSGSSKEKLEQGAGSINAAGAIALTRAIDPAAPAGTPWLEQGVLPTTTIAGQDLQWAQHIVWGDHVVWGDTALWNLAQWADHIVWGDMFGDHIVWGDSFLRDVNLVTSNMTEWADHIVWGDSLLDHVVWGDSLDHVVWGDLSDHVVWGDSLDHVVWGDSLLGGVLGILGI